MGRGAPDAEAAGALRVLRMVTLAANAADAGTGFGTRPVSEPLGVRIAPAASRTPASLAHDDRGRSVAGREAVALATCVRFAPAVLRGGAGNRSRRVSRTRGARANRARPTPVDPRGTNSRPTHAPGGDKRSRQTQMPSWSNPAGCRVVKAAVRVQIATRASPLWLKRASADLVSRRMPVQVRPAAWTRSSTDRAPAF